MSLVTNSCQELWIFLYKVYAWQWTRGGSQKKAISFWSPELLVEWLDRQKKKMNEGSFGKHPVFLCLTCPGPYLFLGQLSGLGKETSYSSPHTGAGTDCALRLPFPCGPGPGFALSQSLGMGEGRKSSLSPSLKGRTWERHSNYLTELSIWEGQPTGRGKSIS